MEEIKNRVDSGNVHQMYSDQTPTSGSMDDGDPTSTNLYLGNLAPTVTEEALQARRVLLFHDSPGYVVLFPGLGAISFASPSADCTSRRGFARGVGVVGSRSSREERTRRRDVWCMDVVLIHSTRPRRCVQREMRGGRSSD